MSERPNDLDVWVLAGQSNMHGCGQLIDGLPPDPRVWSFSSAGQWEQATEPLHRLWESFTPVHQNFMRAGMAEDMRKKSDAEFAAEEQRVRKHGAGLGLSFGKTLAEALGKPIGLIPAAHGGTSLDQWSPAKKSEGGRSLYGAMLERIARAGGTLRGVLWYQGETDAIMLDAAYTYARRMTEWINAVRADTGLPGLPVFIVQLGVCTSWPENSPIAAAWDVVRQAHYELAARIPAVATTTAIDLDLVDPIHIGGRGLVRLGARMARQALGLAYGRDVLAGPRLAGVDRIAEDWGRETLRLTFTGVTGSWRPSEHIAGFSILAGHGGPHHNNFVFDAAPDRADPSALLVRLNQALGPGDILAYGQGLMPYCNATDEADMPLCAFQWRTVAA